MKSKFSLIQNVLKQRTGSHTYLSPKTYKACAAWCGLGHKELAEMMCCMWTVGLVSSIVTWHWIILFDEIFFLYFLRTIHVWGRNSSLVVYGLAVDSVAGSILLWGNFPVEGIFPLELTWVQAPVPKNSLRWEYNPRSSLCTDSEDPYVHVLDRWMPVTKTHPARTIHEDGMLTTLMVGLKKNGHICKNLTQKVVNPRDIAGERTHTHTQNPC